MRVILYGYGKELKKEFCNLSNSIEVIAIADKRAEELSVEENSSIPLVCPEEICEYKYDYVAIAPTRLFDPIKQQLVCENRVDIDKIVSMRLLLESNKAKDYSREIHEIESAFPEDVKIYSYIYDENRDKLLKDGYRTRFALPNFDVYLKREKEDTANSWKTETCIYVVTHKDYPFQLLQGYKPICVGGYSNNGWSADSEGESIARLNGCINELTAVYWIWKNTRTKIVGVSHYRRFFCDNEVACYENPLRMESAEEYIKEYELIVNQRTLDSSLTIEEELKCPLSEKAFNDGYFMITENLKKYQPEYLNDYYEVMSNHTLCYYNMFVTTWDIFDAYCKWLFSFLIPAAEEFDVDAYEGQDKRTIGFFAERMLSVWLHHNPLKIKSLPVFVP